MNDKLLALITVFVSGLFGLTVAVVTSLLTTRKENLQYHRNERKVRYDKVESLYIDAVALLDNAIKHTRTPESFDKFAEDLSRLNGRMQLTAAKEVVVQFEAVSNLIERWSTEYRKAMPKRLGETAYSMNPSLKCFI